MTHSTQQAAGEGGLDAWRWIMDLAREEDADDVAASSDAAPPPAARSPGPSSSLAARGGTGSSGVGQTHRPVRVLLCGAPHSGKRTLAAKLCSALATVQASLAGVPVTGTGGAAAFGGSAPPPSNTKRPAPVPPIAGATSTAAGTAAATASGTEAMQFIDLRARRRGAVELQTVELHVVDDPRHMAHFLLEPVPPAPVGAAERAAFSHATGGPRALRQSTVIVLVVDASAPTTAASELTTWRAAINAAAGLAAGGAGSAGQDAAAVALAEAEARDLGPTLALPVYDAAAGGITLRGLGTLLRVPTIVALTHMDDSSDAALVRRLALPVGLLSGATPALLFHSLVRRWAAAAAAGVFSIGRPSGAAATAVVAAGLRALALYVLRLARSPFAQPDLAAAVRSAVRVDATAGSLIPIGLDSLGALSVECVRAGTATFQTAFTQPVAAPPTVQPHQEVIASLASFWEGFE